VTGADAGRILGKPADPNPTARPPAPGLVSPQPPRKGRTKRDRQRARAAEVRATHQVDLVLVEPGVWQATCRCGRWQARIPARKGRTPAEVRQHQAAEEQAEQARRKRKGRR
jgi:hypothetical protein